MLGTGAFLPIHWGTFNLAVHPWSEPAELVYRQATAAGVPLIMPKVGAPTEPGEEHDASPWWRAIGVAAPEPLADPESAENLEPVERMMD